MLEPRRKETQNTALDKNQSNSDWESYLKLLGGIAASAAAILYFMGWSFGYFYFQQFGLGLLDLDIPFQFFYVYGFWVARDNILLILLGVFAVIVIAEVSHRYVRRIPLSGRVS